MNLKEKIATPIEDTVECIEALARIVKENDLGKIKVSTEDLDIVIEGRKQSAMIPPMTAVASVAASTSAEPAEAVKSAEPVPGNFITSPIIGTFYSSPSPEKPAYVKLGDTVNVGDVVCIIESMKLMNEINSEFSGRVAEIYVNNGDSVEYGQKLFRIE